VTEVIQTPGKLVRDRIPEIIRSAGLDPIVTIAAPEDYNRYLCAKLDEERLEYVNSGDVEELADLVEVCFAAAQAHGVSPDELLGLAQAKRERRGGFTGRLVWLGNADPAR
jgi:predicted house-cleaning noncanonical NTP pyrophosphatase (MazG superfamily)